MFIQIMLLDRHCILTVAFYDNSLKIFLNLFEEVKKNFLPLSNHEHVNNSYRIRKTSFRKYEANCPCPGIGHACKLILTHLQKKSPGDLTRAFFLTLNPNVMPLEHIIINLKRELIRTFAVLDEWFDKDKALRSFKPSYDNWSINEVLEHIMLSNHYQLVVIERCTSAALQLKEREGQKTYWPHNYSLSDPSLHQVADPDAFNWKGKEHQIPTGGQPSWKIRRELRDQLFRCLIALECVPNGEGTLQHEDLPVDALGKRDVYHHIYFLALHAQRHIKQMQRIENSFSKLDVV